MDDLRGRIFLLAFRTLFFRFPSIGKTLLDACGSIENIFEGDRPTLRPLFLDQAALWNRFLKFGQRQMREAEGELKEIERAGLSIISIADPCYPELLRQIVDPPSLLVARGKLVESLGMPMVAMVGSRRASQRAIEAGAAIAEGLAEKGYVVASGLAYGIDSACHRGALSGGGPTVAVMGCGPDIVYPPGNERLYEAVAARGLILSEFPLGALPNKPNFPQRNRIISGMSLATVVVEAAAKSGSLITARFALEQNREVMAVPGAGGTFGARGVNALIRDGAPLVESADDVEAIVSPLLVGRRFLKRAGQFENDVDMDSPLLRAVPARGHASVDEIVAKSGMRAADVLAGLSELRIAGSVEELAGRRWRRKRGSDA